MRGGAVHGVVPGLACGGVTGRTGPAHVNPVISHRHPDICPDETRCAPAEGAPISHRHPDICPDETRGRAIPPARAGADPRPGKNGVAPANRTGPVKPGPLIDAATCRSRSAERVRDFRAQGTGFQGTGTSGGSRPASGMRAGPERVPSREGFFCRWPCRDSCGFFSPAVSRKFRRDPFGGFPARFGRAFRFGKIPVSFQISVGKKLINGVNVLPGTKI